MNKTELLGYINKYHVEKGVGRKHMPFYAAVSDGMRALILFTERLPENKELDNVQHKQLLGIITTELSSEINEWWLPRKLTAKIFEEIYKIILHNVYQNKINKAEFANISAGNSTQYSAVRTPSYRNPFLPLAVPDLAKLDFVSLADDIYFHPEEGEDLGWFRSNPP